MEPGEEERKKVRWVGKKCKEVSLSQIKWGKISTNEARFVRTRSPSMDKVPATELLVGTYPPNKRFLGFVNDGGLVIKHVCRLCPKTHYAQGYCDIHFTTPPE